jgi:hypothetical protein
VKTLSLLLVALLVFSSTGLADQAALAAEPQQGQAAETPQVAKIKAQVQKRGAGEKSKVRVTLANGTMVKGYISKIEDSSFEVNASKNGQPASISYTDVSKIQGPGLSTGAKVAIVVVVGLAVVATIIGIKLATANVGISGGL